LDVFSLVQPFLSHETGEVGVYLPVGGCGFFSERMVVHALRHCIGFPSATLDDVGIQDIERVHDACAIMPKIVEAEMREPFSLIVFLNIGRQLLKT
jgi:hypothetical protein